MPTLAADGTRGISVLEMLIAFSLGAVLATLAVAGASNATHNARNAQCLSRMHHLGGGIFLYSQDHNGEFPRSCYSAANAGKKPWGKAILPYLGLPGDPSDAEWEAIFKVHYRCPADKSSKPPLWSYGLNVHFELNPDVDDYEGSPATWCRMANVERPCPTILLGEPRGVDEADYIKCHRWTSAKEASDAIDGLRHGKTSNYLYVDGHVKSLPVLTSYNPEKSVNRWNPALAK